MRKILRVIAVSCFFIGVEDFDELLKYGGFTKPQTRSRLSFSTSIEKFEALSGVASCEKSKGSKTSMSTLDPLPVLCLLLVS